MENLSEIKDGRFKKGCIPWNKGLKGYPLNWKSKKRPYISGPNHPHWKGGVTSSNEKVRKSIEYKLWRKSVFERDEYTCVFCLKKSKKGIKAFLHADHIKPFALYPELRLELTNGRTLCIDCHKTTDTYGTKSKRSGTKTAIAK